MSLNLADLGKRILMLGGESDMCCSPANQDRVLTDKLRRTHG
jgi:hypothetical protein